MSNNYRLESNGFSLVELLVVMGIVSVLSGLLLPAVQNSRESARRITCTDHLHNQILALTSYQAAHGRLPPGRLFGEESKPGKSLDYSWATFVLPHLDQATLLNRFDTNLPWYTAGNRQHVLAAIPIFRCPSTTLEFPGDTDYGGILGTAMTLSSDDQAAGEPIFDRGVLINANHMHQGIRFSQITDGLSNTLALAEAADFTEEEQGFWVNGVHCISHDAGGVNTDRNGIVSLHPGGAQGARADGSVSFFSESVEPEVLGALCTRSGND